MAVERRARCPSCARVIRVTEEELVDKRGFCAVCDARFDITPERLEGAAPHRENALVPVVKAAPVALTAPPSGRLATRRAPDGGQLYLRPNRLPAPFFAIFGVFFWGLLFVKMPPLPFALFIALLGSVPVGLTLWSLLGRERLRMRDGVLTWTREIAGVQLQRRALPPGAAVTADIERLPGASGKRTATVVRVRADGRIAMDLGGSLGLDDAEAEWTRDWIIDATAAREPHEG